MSSKLLAKDSLCVSECAGQVNYQSVIQDRPVVAYNSDNTGSASMLELVHVDAGSRQMTAVSVDVGNVDHGFHHQLIEDESNHIPGDEAGTTFLE